MNATAETLRRYEIFDDQPPEALDRLATLAVRRRLPAGAELFRAGQPRSACYLIVGGHLELRTDDGDASRAVVALGPGEVAGEAALLEPGIHAATARASDELEVLELDAEAVRASLSGDAPTAMRLFARIARVIVRRLQYTVARRAGWDLVYRAGATRTEHDLLGERKVPADARYGIQTLRAVENFPITGIRLAHFPHLVRALAMVKQAAARANHTLGLLPDNLAAAIDRACQEVIDGHWHGHFVVDVIQGGAGTSTNMNANEVIANRALELMGRPLGDYEHCHPNNHLNLSQSTNDVYPTAVRVALILRMAELLGALRELERALRFKAAEFSDALKMGRTQLQDAVPMTLGQEFEAYAVTTAEDIARLEETARLFLEINLGGTAIGTGINADPRYPALAIAELARISGLSLVAAPNLVEATPDTGAFVMFSGVLKRVAVKLSKMCNDLRLLSSGPRCGLGEINLPAMQPGSSIMPGKVNPVIPEVVNQIAFQVIGNDLTITLAAEAGQLQLNVMEPVITFALFESLDMLAAGVRTLSERCIAGIAANRERMNAMVEGSIGLVTALVPVLGYERASAIAKEALASGRGVREIVRAAGDLDDAELDRLLSPEAMTRPRPADAIGGSHGRGAKGPRV
ncbi:MAG TPA: aspartate ammonia-lyase [Thermoanaerobaculales bacterium]|nr:aspartate ammonia-lyase [Thermoanaerobaculales bacterium]HQL30877.1 aspartate ammonia-lyase [Thermoanaerobaculales bacterium]HQN96971.1 aspartate ammonia-lyase [Thermoanaerobaculales bacterium]HQP42532.1 aspartate ammonia-lyase [Thermoanaerobaculales bacterium]